MRYVVQWVLETKPRPFRVVGYYVRDTKKFDKACVFEHKDKAVCEKVAGILNEEYMDVPY